MYRKILSVFFIVSAFCPMHAARPVRIGFYNVENFFDCKHDSLKNDLDFTPEGSYRWHWGRFAEKKTNIAKTIAAMGGEHGLALLGLCEIENREVLVSLLYASPLKNAGYRFVHYESPDERGIDVALIYNPSRFDVVHSEPVHVSFPEMPGVRTRDILYVKGIAETGDTLHVFVCHAPSRRGGEAVSRHKRTAFATCLRYRCDSIFARNVSARIVIMGDFNDNPSDVSMSKVLCAHLDTEKKVPAALYNLMGRLHAEGRGSYKYQGEWDMLDQIIVSSSLLDADGLHVSSDGACIFDAGFLLERDTKNFGYKPFRTFLGPRYMGGFSDHLPVYFELVDDEVK